MRQFVCNKSLTGAGFRGELPIAKDNVIANRVREGANGVC
jgi:hypothetical protein